MKQDYDVIIIGAGMVGSSLVVALLDQAAQQGLKIALVEPDKVKAGQLQPPSPKGSKSNASVEVRYQSSFDARTTALGFGSAKIFQQLSVWQALQKHLQAIRQIHVSDKGHFGATRLEAELENVPALGYVVENKWLLDVLFSHIQEHPNRAHLKVYCPCSVKSIVREAGRTTLQLDAADEQLSAALVVMADGGRSSLRDALGISYTEHDYQQHALICNVELDRAHQSIAYERFTDAGPIALLPLLCQKAAHRYSLVWTLAEADVEAVLGLSEPAFLSALQQRFGYRAGRFIKVGTRDSYPLKLQTAQEQVRSGLAIVGNAAHTLHPIAGQGFNLALRGVISLAESIISAARNQCPLGDYNMLKQFEQSRLKDQRATINFTDRSMYLFTNSNPLISLGRDLGLQLLDICPPVKSVFARQAMGLASPMSDLK